MSLRSLILLATLLDRVRRLLEIELPEDDLKVPRVVLDRGDIVDRLAKPTMLRIGQFRKGTTLNIDEMWDLEGVL